VSISARNGLIPIVSRWIALTSPKQIPRAIKRKITLAAEANALHNAHLSDELKRIIDSFSKSGIDAIAVKGPVLAALAYGDISLRTFVDLDLLVHSSDLPRAVRILVSAGYTAVSVNDRPAEPEIFSAFPTSFEARRGSDYVDLHWQVGPTRIRFFPDEDSLWARSVRLDYQGTRVRSFSPADQVIYLCAHATKHGWTALSMVCDVAGLIKRSSIDWDWIVAEGRRLHGLRMILLGLYLPHRLMRAEIPESMMRLTHADPEVQILAEQISRELFIAPEEKIEPANVEAIAVRAMEQTSDRLRYWFYRSITPTLGDWTFLPLPTRPTSSSARFDSHLYRCARRWLLAERPKHSWPVVADAEQPSVPPIAGNSAILERRLRSALRRNSARRYRDSVRGTGR
jgi:hypothetical protein